MNKKMNKHWVSIWGNAASISDNKAERYTKNMTLRYPIHIPFSGESVRLTFDNFCGTEDVTISKVTVLYKGEFYPVLYNGERKMTIPKEEKIVTDALDIQVDANETLEVNFYFEDFAQMRASVVTTGPLSKGYYSDGDQTETIILNTAKTRVTQQVYFLTNVSVLTEKENRAIVCFGDSITAQAWPDYLQLRCKEEGYQHTAVVRRAVSGSRILRQYDCNDFECYGLSGKIRFPHDVPTDGADTVIILHGINDIIHPVGEEESEFRPWSDLPTVEELIEGYKGYVKIARELGYKVYTGTLLPIEGWRTYLPLRDDIREAYNEFLRTTDLVDGIIDFEKEMKDPENPRKLFEVYDCGDHLHPGKDGHQKMAMVVPKELLK